MFWVYGLVWGLGAFIVSGSLAFWLACKHWMYSAMLTLATPLNLSSIAGSILGGCREI